MSHNRDLSAAAAQLGFHSSNIGIGTETPGTKLDVRGGNWSNGDIVVGQSGNAGRIKFRRGADGSDSAFIGFAAADNNSRLSIGVDSGDGTIAFQTNSSERLRITSAGRIGINQTSPGAMLQVDYDEGSSEVGLRLRAYNAAGSKTWQLSEINGTPGVFTIRNATNAQNNLSIDGSSGYVGVNATNPDRRLEVVETASSLTFPVAVSNHTDASAGVGAGIAFHLTAGGNARGDFGVVYAGNSNSDGTDFVFRPNDGSTGSVERLRIKGSSGKFGFNTANPPRDYCFHSGQADTNIQITNNTTGIDDSAGALIQQDGNDLYIWNKENSFMSLGTNATERMRLYSNGKLHLGNSHRSSSNLTRFHVGWNTGGTVAGESIIAGTLGNDTTAVSALLTIKNAGNRGAVGASGGSSLAKFEFNNGTAFEIDKHGRRTLPYQPSFKVKLSGATGANFTGYLVFTSVSYNTGSHYNTSNGRFTAPIDGKYLFCWYTNMERAGGNGSFYAEWYINGNAQGNRMYSHHSGAWELIGGTIIFDLNANDYVQIRAMTSGNWDGGAYGSYSGYMLG